MVTGNIFEGILVNQILKSPWISVAFSKILSNSGINDGAKWQFCKRTHFPYFIAFLIALYAIYPCPWPSDKLDKLFFKLSLSARLVISIRGSAPGLKMKIKGVLQSESL